MRLKPIEPSEPLKEAITEAVIAELVAQAEMEGSFHPAAAFEVEFNPMVKLETGETAPMIEKPAVVCLNASKSEEQRQWTEEEIKAQVQLVEETPRPSEEEIKEIIRKGLQEAKVDREQADYDATVSAEGTIVRFIEKVGNHTQGTTASVAETFIIEAMTWQDVVTVINRALTDERAIDTSKLGPSRPGGS